MNYGKEPRMDTKASRVLIVDDMPINRMILSSLLAANGVLSDQADGGNECLALCEKNHYDLILLDHRMPIMDGVDTLMALKELFKKQNRQVPVCCHTTEEGKNNINLYKAAGFAEVLIKPIDPAELSSVLMTYLPEKDRISAMENALPDISAVISNEEIDDEDIRDELDKLPMWLKTVPHLDLSGGIKNCGGAEDFVDALYIFHSSIDEKCSEINYCFQTKDLTMYKMKAHSLKSMARLVGARMLFETAKALEEAVDAKNFIAINKNTPALLSAYRIFETLLAPIKDDEKIKQLLAETAYEPAETEKPEQKDYTTVLFINPGKGIFSTGIINNLKSSDYNVIPVPDEPDMIITYRNEADIILYYPRTGDDAHIGVTMNLLGEICRDDSKILCLTGEPLDIGVAMQAAGAGRVSRTYERPVSITNFIKDMDHLSFLLNEYRRKKTLYVVDDDPDYLSVVSHWLSCDHTYNVSSFSNGQDLLDGLSASMPDLVLLDYEMPGLDGYELMRLIRSDSATKMIPVIFLTGKNDRDHVFRILDNKPDGYLLKTLQKDGLLDAISRFFSETFFRKSQEPEEE